MPGYQIFEKSYLRTYRANGIEPHSNKMGILDFLRDVQIVCKGKLLRGDSLALKYRDQVLPIDLIFGDLKKQVDAQKNEFYLASFNLTSG